MLAPRFEASGVGADVRRPAEPVFVRVSAAAVKRAVLNVLLNATQHAGTGGRVAVEVVRDGQRARLDVRDTGPGIPKADRERIFEMFYTTRPQGTGLGLFLARTAVEQNGGTLAAIEPAGSGACFRLEFPLAEKEPT